VHRGRGGGDGSAASKERGCIEEGPTAAPAEPIPLQSPRHGKKGGCHAGGGGGVYNIAPFLQGALVLGALVSPTPGGPQERVPWWRRVFDA
jgi:hypothetical protein